MVERFIRDIGIIVLAHALVYTVEVTFETAALTNLVLIDIVEITS